MEVHNEAVRSAVEVLPSVLVGPGVDHLIQREWMLSGRKEHVQGNLFSVFQPPVSMDMEKLPSKEGALRKAPQMPCEVAYVGLTSSLKVLQDMMHLRELMQV